MYVWYWTLSVHAKYQTTSSPRHAHMCNVMYILQQMQLFILFCIINLRVDALRIVQLFRIHDLCFLLSLTKFIITVSSFCRFITCTNLQPDMMFMITSFQHFLIGAEYNIIYRGNWNVHINKHLPIALFHPNICFQFDIYKLCVLRSVSDIKYW